MMYWRAPGQAGPRPMRVARVRWMSVVAAGLYLVGAFLLLNAPSGDVIRTAEVTGDILIVLALAGTILIMLTGTQRIAGEEAAKLDDMELRLREKALSRAFHIFSAAMLIGVFYLEVAHDVAKKDIHLWMPSSGDDWRIVFWGLMIALIILPSAILSWMLPMGEPEE